MAKSTDITEAARLLTQAATSLINSPLLHNGQNSQSGQRLTSSETSRSVPTAVAVPNQDKTLVVVVVLVGQSEHEMNFGDCLPRIIHRRLVLGRRLRLNAGLPRTHKQGRRKERQ